MIEAVPGIVILSSLIAGFAWGRISSHLPIPESLRLLTTPLWTGTLMVIAGWVVSVVHLDWSSPPVVDVAKLGTVPVLQVAFKYGAFCFLVGAVLGLPATLGWACGYRPMPKTAPTRD